MKKIFLGWGIVFTVLILTVVILGITYLGNAASQGYTEKLLSRQTNMITGELEKSGDKVLWTGDTEDLEQGFSFFVLDREKNILAEGNTVVFDEADRKQITDAMGPPDGKRQEQKKDDEKRRQNEKRLIIDGDEYLSRVRVYHINRHEADDTELSIIGLIREKDVDNIYDNARLYLILWAVAVAIVMLGLLYAVSISLSKNIENISHQAEKIGRSNDFSHRLECTAIFPELVALTEAHNRLLDRVEDMIRAQKQFGRSVSHELRTPITVIDAQCQAIRNDDNADEKTAERIGRIERQNARMKELVKQLLIMSRLEMGSRDEEDEDISLDEVVEFVCSDIEDIVDSGELFYLSLEHITVRANMSYMVMLINNLLTNALKYGRSNKKTEVSLYRQNNRVIFCVRDYGSGISDEMKSRIFDSFYRGDASRSKEGYGLGLTIARDIAVFYGGGIEADSPDGGGARFTVELDL